MSGGTISIAMASYNGARFITEQLESFAGQTRPPDEVVICDDRSSDGTQEAVEAFAARAAFPVRFHTNPQRLGYTRNFERAILLCEGDIIFLSDQDDAWFADKLETVCGRFEAAPEVVVVVNDQVITDGDLNPSTATKLGNLRGVGRDSAGLIEGCCTAIRAEWARLALPIPGDRPDLVEAHLLSYDRWLNELAILLEVRAVEPRPLQFFRRHGGNTTAWLASEPREAGLGDLIATRVAKVPVEAWRQRIEILDAYRRWIVENRPRLAAAGIGDCDRALARIDHESGAHQARIDLTALPLPRRVAAIARLLRGGGYGYFYGWKSALRDIQRSRG